MLQTNRFLPRGGAIALLIIVATLGVMPLRLVAAAPEVSASVADKNPAPGAPPGAASKYSGERMTVNFQDIDVRTLLQVIADTAHHNIVISDSVKGSVTLRVKNVPWDQVLDIVVHTKGLAKRVQDDVIYISTAQ